MRSASSSTLTASLSVLTGSSGHVERDDRDAVLRRPVVKRGH